MKEDGDKTKGFTVDPNLPRWLCQMCRHPLCVVGADSFAERFAAEPSRSGVQASSIHGAGSVLGASRMDHSFVVLPKQRNQTTGFPPPRPRASGIQYPGSFPMAGGNQLVHRTTGPPDKSSPGQAANSGSDTHGGKAMDESFVVLPSAAASMYRNEPVPEGGGLQSPSSGGNWNNVHQTSNASFNSSVTILKRAFDIASAQTQKFFAENGRKIRWLQIVPLLLYEVVVIMWDCSLFSLNYGQHSNFTTSYSVNNIKWIEKDKVENFTITQSFNKHENWTKALKFTLCNLKWALYWFVSNSSFQPIGNVLTPSSSAPGTRSLHSKVSSEHERKNENVGSSRSQHNASSKSPVR